MNYPVDDVVKNVRYFMNVVKRATGNLQDAAEKGRKDNANKPCESRSTLSMWAETYLLISFSFSYCDTEGYLEFGSGTWHPTIRCLDP